MVTDMLLNILLGLVAEGGTTATVNWGSLINANSFDGIISGITTALPIVIPVAITLMGIPIVWGFIRKMVKKH